ncbi:MAG: carbonic anhydrase family protein [Sulfuritalea sp.]|nr:carbonic anhydrase family protein [Sulfuritalea sp.]
MFHPRQTTGVALAALVATYLIGGFEAGKVFAAVTAIPTPSGQRPQHIPLEPFKLAPLPERKKPVEPVVEPEPEPEPEPVPEPTAAEICKEAEAQLAKCPPKPDPDEPAPKRIHWSYEGEGAPIHWGKLQSAYRACAAGSSQAPIDIRDGIKLNLDPIELAYLPIRINIVDSGYTAEFKVGEGLDIGVMGKRYKLTDFHFHRPSEGRIEGKAFDMELHLIHRNDDGQVAIIAVMIEKGRENPMVQSLLNNLPLEWGTEVSPPDLLDPMQLLPMTLEYWTYIGSLTTPPCTEDVVWMVMKQPLQISAEQIDVFKRFYRKNARPLQPLNGRLIKESR